MPIVPPSSDENTGVNHGISIFVAENETHSHDSNQTRSSLGRSSPSLLPISSNRSHCTVAPLEANQVMVSGLSSQSEGNLAAEAPTRTQVRHHSATLRILEGTIEAGRESSQVEFSQPDSEARPPSYTTIDDNASVARADSYHAATAVHTAAVTAAVTAENLNLIQLLPTIKYIPTYPSISPIPLTYLRVSSLTCRHRIICPAAIAQLNRRALFLCPWGSSHNFLRELLHHLDRITGTQLLLPHTHLTPYAAVRDDKILQDALSLWDLWCENERIKMIKAGDDPRNIGMSNAWVCWVRAAVTDGLLHLNPGHRAHTGYGREDGCSCTAMLFGEGWATWDVEGFWGGARWAVRH